MLKQARCVEARLLDGREAQALRTVAAQVSSSLSLLSLELSDTQVYEPWIRALLGTASHFCEVVVTHTRARVGHTQASVGHTHASVRHTQSLRTVGAQVPGTPRRVLDTPGRVFGIPGRVLHVSPSVWENHVATLRTVAARVHTYPGTEAGSYLRLIDSWITQLKAQGPSRTCNESKEEEKKKYPSYP